MKYVNIFIISIIAIFTTIGCDNELIIEKNRDNIHALLLTKSVPVICIDVFVNWNGELIYIGTACSSSGGGGSGTPSVGSIGNGYNPNDLVISNPYDGGGEATIGSGGGSSSNYNSTTQSQEYKFEMLKSFYTLTSNLNLEQKGQINNLLIYFFDTNSRRNLYNYMCSKKVQVTFIYDPNISTDALYDTSTKTIKIKNPSSLRIDELGEEMIHAAQHQIFYGNNMVANIKNYEFEAKVYFDLSAIFDGGAIDYRPTVTDSRPEFSDSYEQWINRITINGRFTDVVGFNSFCQIWQGYSGTANSSFSPSLLLYFFRKPIPPQPPLF